MATSVFGNKIYYSGGRSANLPFIFGEDDIESVRSTVYQVTVKWDGCSIMEQPSMNSVRTNHGMVNYDGSLWVIGGSNGSEPMEEVEFIPHLDEEVK